MCSFMKKFEGSWHIQPFTERTLQELDQQHHLPGPFAALKLPSPLAALQSMRESGGRPATAPQTAHSIRHTHPGLSASKGQANNSMLDVVLSALALSCSGLFHHKEQSTSTLATLEQLVQPKSAGPPGVKSLIRRLCAKQIKDMMEASGERCGPRWGED